MKSIVPAYYTVKMDILDKIKQDEYPVGCQLPTDMEFCELYNVSRITIRRALSELEAEGYIERRQGKGSYVKFKDIKQSIQKFYSFTNEMIKMGFVPSSIFLKLEKIKPDERVKQYLQIKDDEMVYLLERLRLADEKCIAYDRSYMPESVVPNFSKEMLVEGSLYKSLEKYYGCKPDNSEETIEAITITNEDATKMRIKQNSPVLLVNRVSYSNEKIVEYNYRIVNSKVYKYRFKLES